MHKLPFSVLSLLFVVGCGASHPAPASPTPPAAAAAAAPARLQLGAGKLTFTTDGTPRAEITIAADGSATIKGLAGKHAGETKPARVTADGQLEVDGAPIARLDDANAVSVFVKSTEMVDGKVTHHEEKWVTIGTLDDRGAFLSKDGHKLSIEGGRIAGLPAGLTIDVAPGTPPRVAMLFTTGMFGSSSSTSSTTSSPTATAATPPAPPPAPAPAK